MIKDLVNKNLVVRNIYIVNTKVLYVPVFDLHFVSYVTKISHTDVESDYKIM